MKELRWVPLLVAPLFYLGCGSSESTDSSSAGRTNAGAPSSLAGGGAGGSLTSGGAPSAGAPALSGAGGGLAQAGSGGSAAGAAGTLEGAGSAGANNGGNSGQASSGTGGAVGVAGMPGASGASGRASACNFASGLNDPWIRFANDVPNPDINTFKAAFKNTHDTGGKIVRWWFHTNGTVTPGYDSNGMAKGLQQSHVDGVKAILAAAHDAGLSLVISLWSFDMLQDNAGAAHTNNQKLLEVDANRQAYINNYLTPLVKALKGTPGLYAYETFNEPEGMTPSGWATYRTQVKYIQTCVNQFASAIHDADPNVLVTNGTQVFQFNSVGGGRTNNYSDSALRAAGGKQNGTLDFYEVHYYTVNGSANSPFTKKASDWGLDKKLVMGEFYAVDQDGVAKKDLYTYLFDKGYNGAWGWAYDANWNDIQVPMRTLNQAHGDLTCP